MNIKVALSLLIFIVAVALFSCQSATTQDTLSPAGQIVTPAALVIDQSEIGSTAGIFVMGILIAFISLAPVAFRKKK